MDKRVMIVRPEVAQAPPLPWSVRSVGWRDQRRPWREVNPPRDFVQIIWVDSGAGFLHGCRGTAAVPLRTGMVGWYLPGETHDLRCDQPWSYRWLTMDRGGAEQFLQACGYDHERRFLQPAVLSPAALFERLAVDVADPRGARRAFATAVAICAQAAEPPPPDDDPLVSRCLQLIENGFADANLDVAGLARRLRVHRATLHRRCVRQWGMGPGPRLQARRLSAVLKELGSASGGIAAIAAACGFADAAYCARIVRRATGLPPRALRGLRQD